MGTIRFSAVQELIGGAGEDRFDVVSGAATGMTLDGQGGDRDIFLTKWDASYTLSDSRLSITDSIRTRDFVFRRIEIANLIGGDGDNLMNALAFSGRAILDGGKGNDHLRGGSGSDLLLGREGDDILVGNGGGDQMYGGAGRDILSGGEGSDAMDGGTGEDILLGGRYEQDNIKAALDTIMTTWREATLYSSRIAKIRDTGVGNKKQYRLSSATVFDDAHTDFLIGASDFDWYFSQVSPTSLGFERPSQETNEIVTPLTPKTMS